MPPEMNNTEIYVHPNSQNGFAVFLDHLGSHGSILYFYGEEKFGPLCNIKWRKLSIFALNDNNNDNNNIFAIVQSTVSGFLKDSNTN